MNQSMYTEFTDLHGGASPLLLPNIWDAASAVLFQGAGARALATSSASLSWALGYGDNGALPRAELLGAVRRIARVARVPLTVDIMDGFSNDPQQVAELAVEIVQAGAAGINIEDGAGTPGLLSNKIAAVRRALDGRPLFINARTDVYLLGLAAGEEAVALSIDRLMEYQSAGADGAFVPCLTSVAEAARIASAMSMPLNLMLLPGMATVPELFAAGVRRLSAGPATFQAAYGLAVKLAQQFLERGEAGAMFEHNFTVEGLNGAFAKAVSA